MRARGPAWRQARWWVIVLVVLLGHLGTTHWLAGQHERLQAHAATPRWSATFVRELRPSTPVLVARAAPSISTTPRPRRGPATTSAPATEPASAPTSTPASTPASASAPSIDAPVDPPPTASGEAVPPPATEAAGNVAAAAPDGDGASAPVAPAPPLAASAAALAASVPADPGPASTSDGFAWPASTRIRYTLTGQFRGEVHGRAEVQWVRQGDRYQVHLEAFIGPGFAPLGSRRMSSSGRTSARGLQPQQYEQETRMMWTEPRRLEMRFEADAVTLANGRRVPRPAGSDDMQDTASQFVQLVWLFRSQPERLAVGQRIDLQLAFPRRLVRWAYDVVGRIEVATPYGPVEAFHLKPPQDATGGDWTTEMWFAPALQHLPVRLLIRQDPQTFVDLQMDGLPEQALR